MKAPQEKYYQLVLLWVIDLVKFQSYIEKVAPIVAKYGDHADRILQPTKIWAAGIEIPT